MSNTCLLQTYAETQLKSPFPHHDFSRLRPPHDEDGRGDVGKTTFRNFRI
ncbi:hypothetical protein DAI22_03g297400 [Oryza sativa Japonica Group]|nr:hypothetical protein DAI22_03g297400 [Oryza sativa Japonica Group]